MGDGCNFTVRNSDIQTQGLAKRWHKAAVVLLLSALLVACSTTTHNIRRHDSYYTVKRGETLYSLSWRYGLDYKEVAQWNDIKSPYTIYPGQRVYLNPRSPATARNAPRQSTTTALPATRSAPRKPPPLAAASVPRKSPPLAAGGNAWQWPTRGKVIRSFSATLNGKKGIDIAGQPGQPVRATSPGWVVYSGSGLRGYGRLIIIKHNSAFLSAYAHNRKLLVEEGEEVKAGQLIAELGSSGADRPMLHFEIRRDGKPVDPLGYLPRSNK